MNGRLLEKSCEESTRSRTISYRRKDSSISSAQFNRLHYHPDWTMIDISLSKDIFSKYGTCKFNYYDPI